MGLADSPRLSGPIVLIGSELALSQIPRKPCPSELYEWAGEAAISSICLELSQSSYLLFSTCSDQMEYRDSSSTGSDDRVLVALGDLFNSLHSAFFRAHFA